MLIESWMLPCGGAKAARTEPQSKKHRSERPTTSAATTGDPASGPDGKAVGLLVVQLEHVLDVRGLVGGEDLRGESLMTG